MQSTPAQNLFEYAIVRFTPDIERGEFVNIGLIMMCKRRKWICCEFHLDKSKILALNKNADIDLLATQLQGFSAVAAGKHSPIGQLPVHERFRWLTAMRSACIGTSRPHPGLCTDLEETFRNHFKTLVL